MAEAIRRRECYDPDEVMAYLQDHPCKALTILDELYPKQLASIPSAPFVLYYEGDLSLVQDGGRCVTMVGARECTDYGREKTLEIAKDLAREGLTIVSGLARGIDTAAAEGAVNEGRAVAVLGSGFNHIYPSENITLAEKIKSRGLLLSEYPPFVPPAAINFPRRNRILAGLSCLSLIMEAKPRSGTLITAAFATCFGRDVGCLPFRSNEEFINNEMIKDGAVLVESSADVLAALRPDVISELALEKSEKSL